MVASMCFTKILKLGMLVDTVQEVLEFEDSIILPSPTTGENCNSELIEGVVENEGKLLMRLYISKLPDIDGILRISNNQKKLKIRNHEMERFKTE